MFTRYFIFLREVYLLRVLEDDVFNGLFEPKSN